MNRPGWKSMNTASSITSRSALVLRSSSQPWFTEMKAKPASGGAGEGDQGWPVPLTPINSSLGLSTNMKGSRAMRIE